MVGEVGKWESPSREMSEVPFTLSSSDLGTLSSDYSWSEYQSFLMGNGLNLIFSFSYEIQPEPDVFLRLSVNLDVEKTEESMGEMPELVWLRGIGAHCEPYGDHDIWRLLDQPLFLGLNHDPILLDLPALVVRPGELNPILLLGVLRFTFLDDSCEGMSPWDKYNIPLNVTSSIFRHLVSFKDRLNCSLVCRDWHLIVKSEPRTWGDVTSLEVTGMRKGKPLLNQLTLGNVFSALSYLSARGAPIRSLELSYFINKVSGMDFLNIAMTELRDVNLCLEGLAACFWVDYETLWSNLLLLLYSQPSLKRLYLGPFQHFVYEREPMPLESLGDLGSSVLPQLRSLCIFPSDISEAGRVPDMVVERLEAFLVHVPCLSGGLSSALVDALEEWLGIVAPNLRRCYRYPLPDTAHSGFILFWATHLISAPDLFLLQDTALALLLLTPQFGLPRSI